MEYILPLNFEQLLGFTVNTLLLCLWSSSKFSPMPIDHGTKTRIINLLEIHKFEKTINIKETFVMHQYLLPYC